MTGIDKCGIKWLILVLREIHNVIKVVKLGHLKT